MSPEKLSTEIRQEQIAQAALNLIASEGMRGLNMAEIARQINIVPSAIYRHYRSKEQILDAIVTMIGKRLLGNVKAVCDETSDSLERLHRLLVRHIRLLRENEAIPHVVFSQEVYSGDSKRKSQLYRIISNYLGKIRDIISLGQEEGSIRAELDPDVVSVMFLGLIQPAAIIWHVSEGGFDVTRQADQGWEIFKFSIERR